LVFVASHLVYQVVEFTGVAWRADSTRDFMPEISRVLIVHIHVLAVKPGFWQVRTIEVVVFGFALG